MCQKNAFRHQRLHQEQSRLIQNMIESPNTQEAVFDKILAIFAAKLDDHKFANRNKSPSPDCIK